MKTNRKLTELKNIGKKIAGRLNEVGIFSEDEIQNVGAANAHKMIKEKYPEHWNDIGEKKKRELKEKIG